MGLLDRVKQNQTGAPPVSGPASNGPAVATAPGGALVYSVCTISRSEGEDVVDGFLRGHPDFVAEELPATHPELGRPAAAAHLQLLPHRDGTDGFFIARLRRR